MKYCWQFVWIHSIRFNSLVKFTTNWRLLSDITLSSSPCSFYMLSSANISSVAATKYIFDNMLHTTRIVSFSTTNGNLVMKSTVKYVHGLILLSRLQEVDLVFLIFFSYFYFLFNLFFFILFLELGLGLEWQDHAVTQQVTSDDMVTSHMTYIERRRRFWKDDVIQCVKHMLTLRHTHGCLG